MSTAALRGVVRGLVLDGPPSDAALVTRYARLNDHGAFAELLRRHGPVVLGVCRRTLGHADADDAFQAVFLVLARKAGAVRPPGSVGGWLYGVAVRVSKKARVAAARRWRREMHRMASPGREAGDAPGYPGAYAPGSPEHEELRAVIDAELGRLPDKLRLPVVLCDLGGKTRSEAARELGLPDGTVAARLHQARKLLADRLSRRGVALPAAGVGVLAAAEPVSADLARATLAAAGAFAEGTASPVISTTAQALAEGVVRAMNATSWKVGLGMVLAAVLVAGGGLMWAASGTAPPGGGDKKDGGAKAEAAVTTDAPGYVADVSFSPDGTRYAVVAGGKVTVHAAATGKVLWTAAGEAARFVPGPKREGAGPDGERIELPPAQQYVSVLDAKGLVYRRAASGEIVFRLGGDAGAPKAVPGWSRVRFSPDGEQYAAHTDTGVRVYDQPTGFKQIELKDRHGPAAGDKPPAVGRDVFFSRDGRYVVGVGVEVEPGNVGLGLWRVDTGERLFAVGGEKGLTAAAPGHDREALAVGYTDRVDLWPPIPVADPKAGAVDRGPRRSPRKVAPDGVPTALAYSPDGKTLAAAVRSAKSKPVVEVQLFDVATGKELRRFGGFGKLPVTALAFSPDGKQLAAGTGLHPSIRELAAETPKAGEVRVFALAPEAAPPKDEPKPDDRPAIVERNQDLWAWQERPAKPNPQDKPGPVDAVAYAPGGKEYAGAGGREVRFWDVPSKELHTVKVLAAPGRGVVAYSPDGKLLALPGERGGVAVHQAGPNGRFSPGEYVLTVGDDARPMAAAFGPADEAQRYGRNPKVVGMYRLAFTDGRAVWATSWVEGGAPGTAKFGPLADAPKVERPHAGVAYSPDGRRLVFIPNSKIDPTWPANGAGRPDPAKATHWYAQVWGGGSGEPMHMLAHGPDPVTAVAWAPDGRILTADNKGVVIVWDGTTYKKRAEVKLSGPITALAVRSDGKRLAAGVRVPPAAPGDKGITQIEVRTEQDGATPDNWMALETLGLQPDEVVRSVAFSPEGRVMVAGTATADGKGGGLRVWDRVKLAPKDGAGEPPAAAPTADPPAAAAPAPVWREKARLTDFAGPVQSVAFTPDGNTLFAGHRTPARGTVPAVGGVNRFDLPEYQLVEQGRNGRDDGATTAVAADPLGRFLVTTVGKGLRVRFLSEPRAAFAPGLPADSAGELAAVQFSADGSHLAAGNDRAVVVWRPDQEKPDVTPARPKDAAGDRPPAFALSPTGDRLAFAHQLDSGAWELAVVWPFAPAAAYQVNRSTGAEPVRAVAWSPDGKTIAYAAGSEVVLIDGDYGNHTERSRTKITGRNGSSVCHALAFSPDGKALAAGVRLDAGKGVNRVILIDPATGKQGDFLTGGLPVAAVAWSPDGKTLAVAHGPRPGDDVAITADEIKEHGGVVLWERGPAR